jgi:hypothetical protein
VEEAHIVWEVDNTSIPEVHLNVEIIPRLIEKRLFLIDSVQIREKAE